MSLRFPLPPTGKIARVMPYVVGLALPLLLAAAFVATAPPDASAWWGIGAGLMLLPLTGLAFARLWQGRVVELAEGRLTVRRWPVPRRFDASAILLDAARIAEPWRERELQPFIKLAGTRMPGMHSGWFLTRGRKRAYLLATTGERVALLPLRDGRLLMLGVERPQALLDALRDEAARHR